MKTWDELKAGATSPEINVRSPARRKTRYWCFRLGKQADHESRGGTHKIAGIPEGLKEYFEDVIGFAGWDKFGVTWDLRGDPRADPDGSFLVIIPRRHSIQQAWNSELIRGAKTLGV